MWLVAVWSTVLWTLCIPSHKLIVSTWMTQNHHSEHTGSCSLQIHQFDFVWCLLPDPMSVRCFHVCISRLLYDSIFKFKWKHFVWHRAISEKSLRVSQWDRALLEDCMSEVCGPYNEDMCQTYNDGCLILWLSLVYLCSMDRTNTAVIIWL